MRNPHSDLQRRRGRPQKYYARKECCQTARARPFVENALSEETPSEETGRWLLTERVNSTYEDPDEKSFSETL